MLDDRYFDIFETSAGWVGVLASSKGLRRTTLPEPSPHICIEKLGEEIDGATETPDRFEGLRVKIEEFLSGGSPDFSDEAVDFDDAPVFLRTAWEACRTIPSGETRSYKWLAAAAGRPAAPRAAGQSMARNRLPMIIPCHRVISSDGSLGGYGKGKTRLALKERLLQMEGALA